VSFLVSTKRNKINDKVAATGNSNLYYVSILCYSYTKVLDWRDEYEGDIKTFSTVISRQVLVLLKTEMQSGVKGTAVP
jgi:hypothetical protein